MEIILVFSIGLNLLLLWLCHSIGKQCDEMMDECFDLMAEACDLRLKLKEQEHK